MEWLLESLRIPSLFIPASFSFISKHKALVSWSLYWITLTMVSSNLIPLVSSLIKWSLIHECSHLRRIPRKRLKRHPRRRKEEEVERRRRRSGQRERFGTSWITWSSLTRLRMISCWKKFPVTSWSHQPWFLNVSRFVDHWQGEHWKNSIGKDSLNWSWNMPLNASTQGQPRLRMPLNFDSLFCVDSCPYRVNKSTLVS